MYVPTADHILATSLPREVDGHVNRWTTGLVEYVLPYMNLRVRLSCIDSKVSCYSQRHNWQSCSFSLESIMVSYNAQKNAQKKKLHAGGI